MRPAKRRFRGSNPNRSWRRSTPTGIATLISSAIFGLMHAANPNATLVSTLALMLAGRPGIHLEVALLTVVGLHFALGTFEILYLQRTDALG